MTQAKPKPALYDQDLALWLADTIEQLQAGALGKLDVEHLIEELEGLAGRDRNELENRLDVLLAHALKRRYLNSADDYRGWEITLREQQKRIRRLLKQSPSLKNYLSEVFDEVWQDALADVCKAYPDADFPAESPFSRDLELLLTTEFWQPER